MCWISFKLPIPKIATEDIVCYKIFRCRKIKWGTKLFYSLYRDYQYITYAPNPKITINFKKFHTSPSSWSITEGYHSYNTLFKATLEWIFKYFIVPMIGGFIEAIIVGPLKNKNRKL